ncbi:MAG: hypothetical protein JW801_08490 [Bacteroidales bacterium]|nr:hypothetical protein [Bacteroidales bacterium]
MQKILRFTFWQLRLLAKYQILTIAFIIAAFYIAILLLLSWLQTDVITTLFVFLDPTAMGFIFIGVMVLFEKGDNTLEAQVVTPMQTGEYLWAKALALLVPALICSSAIAVSTQGLDFHPHSFFISVILTSLIFTFIGVGGVMWVDTFTQYIVLIPLFTAPTVLPLLNYFGLTRWDFLYIIPTQATLNLLSDSFDKHTSLMQLADIAYLALWTYLSYIFARRQFEKKMYQ